jgi:monoamine oxidase
MGGQWTGPGQDKVMALAKELGIDTFPTFADGDSVYYSGGAAKRYSGDIPPANAAALVELELLIEDLNSKAATVPLDKPWDAPGAAALDAQTIDAYISGRCQTDEARVLARVAVSGVYGEDAALVSLLDLLASVQGVGGDFNTLIGDAQSIRFAGGPQQMSITLAAKLRKSLRLKQEVVAIAQGGGHATIATRTDVFRARRVVLTPPKPVLARIVYRPALPPAFDQWLQRQPMGAVTKVNAIYDAPFWRADGLSGAVVSDTGPIQIVYDNSPPDGLPGVLVGFFEGNASRQIFSLSAGARKAAALDSFARYFGDRARSPTGFHEMTWAAEPFTRGAYGTYSPPGVLTSLGPATAGPAGRLHFAGDATSAEWPGYMDGAIRSGERAAKELIAAL